MNKNDLTLMEAAFLTCLVRAVLVMAPVFAGTMFYGAGLLWDMAIASAPPPVAFMFFLASIVLGMAGGAAVLFWAGIGFFWICAGLVTFNKKDEDKK